MNDSTVITAELARGTFTDEMLERCARSSVPSYVPMTASTMSTRRGWRFCALQKASATAIRYGQIRRMRPRHRTGR